MDTDTLSQADMFMTIYTCNYKVIWAVKNKYYFADNVFEYTKTNRIAATNIDLW